MSTIVSPREQWQADRGFYSGVAAAMLVVTFIGFAPTYYLAGFTNAPPLDPVVHVHGILYSAWILFFLAQNGLIAARRPDIHRVTGAVGLTLALVVFVVGVWVAIHSGALRHGPADRDQHVFLVFPLTAMILFGVFTALGARLRHRPDYHKRLMMLATVALVVTPLARISRMAELPFRPHAIGGMLLSDVFVASLIMYDVKRQGRLHPVTLWAGGAYLLSQPLRVAVGHTATWKAIARALIG
jgi:FtsH-binding integral membrane protein